VQQVDVAAILDFGNFGQEAHKKVDGLLLLVPVVVLSIQAPCTQAPTSKTMGWILNP
jgi:hypothetical protein